MGFAAARHEAEAGATEQSANGIPPEGPFRFERNAATRESELLVFMSSKGEPDVVVATVNKELIALSAASRTAGITDAVAIEPPDTGPSGSDVSPRATSTLSSGTPAFPRRAARESCMCRCRCPACRMPPAPCRHREAGHWPQREIARQSTQRRPCPNQASIRRASSSRLPALRFDQPNFSAPSSRHSSNVAMKMESLTIRRSSAR